MVYSWTSLEPNSYMKIFSDDIDMPFIYYNGNIFRKQSFHLTVLKFYFVKYASSSMFIVTKKAT